MSTTAIEAIWGASTAKREAGTVKWFDPDKGFGFIIPAVGRDIFVHVKDLKKTGLESLDDGQRVSYEIGMGRDGRSLAVNVHLL